MRLWLGTRSYGTESGVYTVRVVAGDSTSVTLAGLRDATTYYVVVQSFTRDGVVGPPSPEVVGQTSPAVVGRTSPAVVGRTSPAVLSISCPAPVLTSLDGRPMQVTLLPSVSGGTQPVTLRCSPASGSLFPLGSVAFTCAAVDAAQQRVSCASAAVVLPPP